MHDIFIDFAIFFVATFVALTVVRLLWPERGWKKEVREANQKIEVQGRNIASLYERLADLELESIGRRKEAAEMDRLREHVAFIRRELGLEDDGR